MKVGIPPGGVMTSLEIEPTVSRKTPCIESVCSAKISGRSHRPERSKITSGVSVVIVNYCQWGNTKRLVRQLQQCECWQKGQARVVIVDNGSSKRGWQEAAPGVRVRYEWRNVGFAAGVNRGVEELVRWKWGIWRGSSALREWYLLLNPDVTVRPGFLDEVLTLVEEIAEVEPRAGVIGLRLCNHDGTLQGSCGRFPTLGSTLRGLLRPRAWRKCQVITSNKRQQVDWVTGGCLLVQRDCFEELNGLDESFFLYYEDVDFCKRAQTLGWQIWYEPRLSIIHHWPLHNRNVPASLRLMTRHALLQYANKHWSKWSIELINLLIWYESLWRQGWCWLRRDPREYKYYAQLRCLVREMRQGKVERVRRRILAVSRHLREVAATQDLADGQGPFNGW